jgi:ribonuclease PH
MCERGLLRRADGSARWRQGSTEVLSAVYGPRAAPGRKEHPEKAIVEVVFKQKSGFIRTGTAGIRVRQGASLGIQTCMPMAPLYGSSVAHPDHQ